MAETILVVDDEAANRDLMEAILTDAGYRVAQAENGLGALAQATAAPPDLILLDLMMPGMNGFEVCRILRQGPRTREIPVVMLTASDDPALNRKAYAAGVQACVPKPFRKQGLLVAIQAALTGMPRQETPSG
jgi:two-component system cell cycle response regulator